MSEETTRSDATEKKDPTEGAVDTAAAPMTMEERDEAAEKLVDRFTLWSGGAGLIPIPLVDIAAVGGVQIQMLRRLSELYDVPFSENAGKSVLASLAGSLIPASAASTTAMGLTSALKLIPGVGTIIAAVTMPAFSAGATYLIGKVFIQHFASGGTLLDFNPPDYREFIKAQKEKLDAQKDKFTAQKDKLTARYRRSPPPAQPESPPPSTSNNAPAGT
jgi:uncharacterized protein (DUF697 family)